jgi:hypothetical protein
MGVMERKDKIFLVQFILQIIFSICLGIFLGLSSFKGRDFNILETILFSVFFNSLFFAILKSIEALIISKTMKKEIKK